MLSYIILKDITLYYLGKYHLIIRYQKILFGIISEGVKFCIMLKDISLIP